MRNIQDVRGISPKNINVLPHKRNKDLMGSSRETSPGTTSFCMPLAASSEKGAQTLFVVHYDFSSGQRLACEPYWTILVAWHVSGHSLKSLKPTLKIQKIGVNVLMLSCEHAATLLLLTNREVENQI